MMYKDKKCAICGKLFSPKSARSKYCSDECRDRAISNQEQNRRNKVVKVCEWCGLEFHPRTNTQKYCDRVHYETCVICGNRFEIDLRKQDKRKTCSKECHDKYKFHNGHPFSDSKSREKARNTMIERYGVDHPMRSPEFQDKQKRTTLERYGVEYFAQSDQYNGKVTATNQKKYGADWPIQSESIKSKCNDVIQSKYGVSNVMNVPEIVDRMQSTMLERYGVPYALQNEEIMQKSRDTNMERYGVSSYSSTEEYKSKFKSTCNDKYGVDNPCKSTEVLDKIADTNMKRYRVKCYLASDENRSRLREAARRRHNVNAFSQSKEWKSHMILYPDKIDEWVKFLDDPKQYILDNYDTYPSLNQLAKDVGVSDTTISYHINKLGLQDMIKYTLSYMENEVVSLLQNICPDITIHRHCRNLIKPYEIDIYLPEYKLGIECNPTATHNSSIGFLSNSPISWNYHKIKTDMCESMGIFLFHIFGYEWVHRRNVIESMLRNLLGRNDRVIYARNCDVREVISSEAMKFLNENHRQGASPSKIKLGLYHKEELVSLMTFGGMRPTMGRDSSNLGDCWELVRFCSVLNTTIVGGASKLFAHFIKQYEPERIRSFSDRSHTKGRLYQLLGFHEIRRSNPSYVWVDIRKDIAYNRVNAQKSNIRRFLNDESIDLSHTEREIMEQHGFVQVFDSGTITWGMEIMKSNLIYFRDG